MNSGELFLVANESEFMGNLYVPQSGNLVQQMFCCLCQLAERPALESTLYRYFYGSALRIEATVKLADLDKLAVQAESSSVAEHSWLSIPSLG
jgi:hypothetical protein